MRAYSYARFSTDNQSDASIHDQQRVCREFAAARGWQIAGEYSDEGISGSALGNRPGAQAALAALARGDVLLISDTARLARSQDLAPLITRLRFRGVRVVGVLDHFDSDAPTADMQAGLSGLISADYIKNIRVRTHSALAMRAQQGRPTGGKAYGYTSKGEPLEGEAAIVREIFERVSQGEALRAIAVDLNMRGVPAPGSTWNRQVRARDARWRVSALHSLLENERYAGRAIWNRSTWTTDPDSGKRIRRDRPATEWIVTECPAIVDPALFAAVRRKAEQRKDYGGGRGGAPRYLLSGLLVCQACGQRMVVTGKRGSMYYCATWRHAGACTMRKGFRRDDAESVILAPVQQELLSPAAVERAVEMMRAWARQEAVEVGSGNSPGVVAIEAEIADLSALVAERPSRAAAILPAIEALQARKATLQRRAWRVGASAASDTSAAEQHYRAAVEAIRETLVGPVARARVALQELLGPIAVHQEGEQLIATVRMQPVLVARNGSGGVLPTHPTAPAIIASVILRAA